MGGIFLYYIFHIILPHTGWDVFHIIFPHTGWEGSEQIWQTVGPWGPTVHEHKDGIDESESVKV